MIQPLKNTSQQIIHFPFGLRSRLSWVTNYSYHAQGNSNKLLTLILSTFYFHVSKSKIHLKSLFFTNSLAGKILVLKVLMIILQFFLPKITFWQQIWPQNRIPWKSSLNCMTQYREIIMNIARFKRGKKNVIFKLIFWLEKINSESKDTVSNFKFSWFVSCESCFFTFENDFC